MRFNTAISRHRFFFVERSHRVGTKPVSRSENFPTTPRNSPPISPKNFGPTVFPLSAFRFPLWAYAPWPNRFPRAGRKAKLKSPSSVTARCALIKSPRRRQRHVEPPQKLRQIQNSIAGNTIQENHRRPQERVHIVVYEADRERSGGIPACRRGRICRPYNAEVFTASKFLKAPWIFFCDKSACLEAPSLRQPKLAAATECRLAPALSRI